METESNTKYFSVNKFIDFINENYPNNSFEQAILYFEGEDTFLNKFDQICCKPIFIQLDSTDNSTYINLKKIEELFETKPIINFHENKFKKIDKKKLNNMFVLVIDFKIKTLNNPEKTTYHSCYVSECQNKRNVEKIRKQVQIEYNENDINDDAFI